MKHFACQWLFRMLSVESARVLKLPVERNKNIMSANSGKATVKYAGDELFIGTTPRGYAQVIDTKGDRHSAPTPMEMLLVSVAACTAVDVISILIKKRQDVTDYDVEITGERREDHPKAFIKFYIHHIVRGRNVSDKAVADAIELSDTKYCSVAATVRPTAEITTSYEIIEVGESHTE
jgi:putative redox protein